MTMNTSDIMDTFTTLRDTANNFMNALQRMGTVLEAAVHDLKDRDEQIRVQQERISSLEEDNKRLQERLAASEEQMWQSRREARQATDMAKDANNVIETMTSQLNESKAEGVKLREIILTVATSVDSVINPKPATLPMEVNQNNPVSGDGGKVLDPTDTRPYWDQDNRQHEGSRY